MVRLPGTLLHRYLPSSISSSLAVPMIVVVKHGLPGEAEWNMKPGNRGKIDSHIILMNFSFKKSRRQETYGAGMRTMLYYSSGLEIACPEYRCGGHGRRGQQG